MADELATQAGAVATVAETNQSLVPQDITGVKSVHATDKAHESLAAGNFPPRLQLMQGLSKLVTKKKTQSGAWCVVKGGDNLLADYGEKFNCIIINWRPKAVMFDAAGKGKAYYNPENPQFQHIEIEGSKKPRPKGFLFGPEYLVYLPDIDQIVTLHFSTPTMRNRAAEMKALIGGAATIMSQFIEANGNAWYGPNVTGCSTPLNLPPVGSPERDALNDRWRVANEKFRTATDGEEVEEVDQEGGKETAAPAANAERPR